MTTKELLDNYYTWLKENYRINSIDENCDEIITPFLDSLNDYIYVYVTHKKDEIILSDDGYTLNNLELMGIDITPTRKKILDNILKTYDISISNTNELYISGDEIDFPSMKFKLTSAIVKIDDLNYTKRTNTFNLFKEEVLHYFKNNNFGGLSNYACSGQSGLSYTLPYIIPKHNKNPHRIFEVASKLSKNLMMQLAYEFSDIQKASVFDGESAEFFVVHDAEDDKISEASKKIAADSNIRILPFGNKKTLESFIYM